MKPLIAKFAIALLLGVSLNISTKAQMQVIDSVDNKPTLAEFAWLAGNWKGEGFGGKVEESWSVARDGAMMGMFRYLKDEKVNFYEFFILVETENGIELRIKHFHRDLTSWEEKNDYVTFPLLEANSGLMLFKGLVIEKQSDTTFRSVVDVAMNGEISKISFNLVKDL